MISPAGCSRSKNPATALRTPRRSMTTTRHAPQWPRRGPGPAFAREPVVPRPINQHRPRAAAAPQQPRDRGQERPTGAQRARRDVRINTPRRPHNKARPPPIEARPAGRGDPCGAPNRGRPAPAWLRLAQAVEDGTRKPRPPPTGYHAKRPAECWCCRTPNRRRASDGRARCRVSSLGWYSSSL